MTSLNESAWRRSIELLADRSQAAERQRFHGPMRDGHYRLRREGGRRSWRRDGSSLRFVGRLRPSPDPHGTVGDLSSPLRSSFARTSRCWLAWLRNMPAGKSPAKNFFAMGSGPMRAAAGKEPLFQHLGYRERAGSSCRRAGNWQAAARTMFVSESLRTAVYRPATFIFLSPGRRAWRARCKSLHASVEDGSA